MHETGIYRALGRAVATRRKQLDKTQKEIAERINLSRASLANIERGRQKVLAHQLYWLVEALELKSITDLIPARPPSFDTPRSTNVKISRSDLSETERASIDSLLASAFDKR